MKLRDLYEETASQYEDRLIKTLGIKRLGAGVFSSVFEHPVYHNVVVKVVRRVDDAYLRYAEWCMQQGTSNPWLPWIISMVPVTLDYEAHEMYGKPNPKVPVPKGKFLPHGRFTGGNTFIIFMQRMEKAYKENIRDAIDYIATTLPEDVVEGLYLYDRRSFLTFDQEDWYGIAKHTTDKHLAAFARMAVAEGFDDIHDGNVMMRGNQLVFVDPVASS